MCVSMRWKYAWAWFHAYIVQNVVFFLWQYLQKCGFFGIFVTANHLV